MERGYTLDELWAAARRRARAGLVVFGAVVVLGTVVVATLPNEYRAEATIVLEPYRPHVELVTPAVTPLLEDRLKIARQELLARPLLEKVVKSQDLYPRLRAKEGLDAAVDSLERHLEVKPDGDAAVIVSYRTNEKDKAAPVVQAIANGYVEANAELREGQAKHVLDIIEAELASVSQQLDAAEAKVRDFRQLHDGELPEQVDGNLREADRMSHMLEDTQGYIHALEARMAGLPTMPNSPEVDRLTALEATLVGQLTHAQSVFTPDHPEPQRLQRELVSLRELKAKAMAQAGDMHKERLDLQREIASLEREANVMETKIKASHDKAVSAAKWQSVLGVLERDRDNLRDKYKSLQSRKVEADVSLGLEQRDAPLATHVVDPPAVPMAPAAPDRLRLFLVVLVLGLGCAVGTGVLLEAKDASVRTPDQARAQLGVPLLAVVPPLRTGK